MPAIIPIKSIEKTIPRKNNGCNNNPRPYSSPVNELKRGIDIKAKTKPSMAAKIVTKIVSPRNCITRDFLEAPKVFLNPTSRALLE
jgi:hypothetical protein